MKRAFLRTVRLELQHLPGKRTPLASLGLFLPGGAGGSAYLRLLQGCHYRGGGHGDAAVRVSVPPIWPQVTFEGDQSMGVFPALLFLSAGAVSLFAGENLLALGGAVVPYRDGTTVIFTGTIKAFLFLLFKPFLIATTPSAAFHIPRQKVLFPVFRSIPRYVDNLSSDIKFITAKKFPVQWSLHTPISS